MVMQNSRSKKKIKKESYGFFVNCSFIICPVLSFLQIMIVFIDFDLNLIKLGFFNSFKILDFFQSSEYLNFLFVETPIPVWLNLEAGSL